MTAGELCCFHKTGCEETSWMEDVCRDQTPEDDIAIVINCDLTYYHYYSCFDWDRTRLIVWMRVQNVFFVMGTLATGMPSKVTLSLFPSV